MRRFPATPALNRFIIGITLFVLIMLVAVVGYTSFGWNWLDALYMYVITVFGIGYSEVRPLMTPAQRFFNMMIIVAGSAATVYTIGAVVQLFTEGEIKQLLEMQRASRDINKLNRHVIVCGFGRIGQVVAQELTASKTPFVILDVNEQRIDLALQLGYLAYLGSAVEQETLQVVGIDRAIALATVLPNDTMNVFITLTARSMNPSLLIVARANLATTESKLRMAGADHIVLPTKIGASQMTNLIRRPRIDFLEQTGDRETLNDLLSHIDARLEELEITPDYPYVGTRLTGLEVRGEGAFIIVGLRKSDGQLFPARANPLVEVGDTLILLGHAQDAPKVIRKYTYRARHPQ
ncbi:potassium channel family protein [Thermosynechococcus vestitus]|uniref:Tlr1378 protein n=1 Tax=Thermosynechococcus vestitus (strain NIES-2133 / IAM M-273 / BP-1) TaxID=197221 RepID=Q8DJ50_THEVB|nr:potassium channel protein [Thermosynechococcus vestitus]BAC08930.1 tlr1378 [Thermosynechococcus vestitus BP-1]